MLFLVALVTLVRLFSGQLGTGEVFVVAIAG